MDSAKTWLELRPAERRRSQPGESAGLPTRDSHEPQVLLASLAINVLSLGLPMVILQVYDRILPNEAMGTLTFLILGLCGVLILDGLFRVARSTMAAWKAAHMEHDLGCQAVEWLLGADIQEFETEAPGVHLDRLYAIDQLREVRRSSADLECPETPEMVFEGDQIQRLTRAS